MRRRGVLLSTIHASACRATVLSGCPSFRSGIILSVNTNAKVLSFFTTGTKTHQMCTIRTSRVTRRTQQLITTGNLANIVRILGKGVRRVSLPRPISIVVDRPVKILLIRRHVVRDFLYNESHFLIPKLVGPDRLFPSSNSVSVTPFASTTLCTSTCSGMSF